MAKIGLSSPWVLYYHEIEAFFKEDPEVTVVFDEGKYELKLYVDSQTKVEALGQMLPTEKKFGNVTLKVFIIPSNNIKFKNFKLSLKSTLDLVRNAFENNNAVKEIVEITIYENPIIYVIFKPEVIQYFTDSLDDAHGLRSTLMQDMAEEIFEWIDGVYYCTDKVNFNITVDMKGFMISSDRLNTACGCK